MQAFCISRETSADVSHRHVYQPIVVVCDQSKDIVERYFGYDSYAHKAMSDMALYIATATVQLMPLYM